LLVCMFAKSWSNGGYRKRTLSRKKNP
jgi:hypothetical protein